MKSSVHGAGHARAPGRPGRTTTPFSTPTKCRSASGSSRRISAASSAMRAWICVGGDERRDVGRHAAAERSTRVRAAAEAPMKRFEIITEADARVARARRRRSTLATGGHVTPLALDTLRERRVTVVRDGARWRRRAAGAGRRHPPGSPSAATTRGIALQAGACATTCAAAGSRCRTSGPTRPTRSTIPTSPARWPAWWRAARPTPASSSTAPASARRSPPTRSTASARRCAPTATLARYAREHNGANVLALGATLRQPAEAALAIVDTWRHDADDRGALHPPAGEDSAPGARPVSDAADSATASTCGA